MSISLILLAGGLGTRMRNKTHKPFLHIGDKPIIFHSLEIFSQHPDVKEIIIVAHAEYHFLFQGVLYAKPGKRRQDSLYNGLQQASHPWICVHDAARPFISESMLNRLFEAGKQAGAATTGMPIKSTIKEVHDGLVHKTLHRDHIWEIQTPQFIAKKVLEQGFDFAHKHSLTVTDDVSLVELIGHPVRLVEGAYTNIKITTPEDLFLAEQYAKI